MFADPFKRVKIVCIIDDGLGVSVENTLYGIRVHWRNKSFLTFAT